MATSSSRLQDPRMAPDQILGLLATAIDAQSGYDLSAVIEKDGNPIAPDEAKRSYSDGKPHLEIMGYLWGVSQDVGASSTSKRPHILYLVRRTDAATASIMSALVAGSENCRVQVDVHRAGGDSDGDPMLQLVVDKARLVTHCLLTASVQHGPCELLGFAGRKFEIKSAPQQTTGLRGGVRTCNFEISAG